MTETRYSVAVVVRREDGFVLAVKRPDDPGEELPGVWGLPAITLRYGESPEEGVRRIGREKLSVDLEPDRAIAAGKQPRPAYTLHVTVYEAAMAGEPSLPRESDSPGTQYVTIDWLPPDAFGEAASKGSLCCELFLRSDG